MAITAIGALTERPFIPADQKDKDGNPLPDAAIFNIKPLGGVAYSKALTHMDHTGRFSHDGVMTILREGLVGWNQHVVDPETGKPLPFSLMNLDKVPPIYHGQVAGEIANISQLGSEQVKNS